MSIKEKVVATCVKSHAMIERHLSEAYSLQEAMVEAIEKGIADGMIADGAEAKKFLWGHKAALGKIADAGLALADLHPIGTQHAKANGVDLGRITEVGGITLPEPEMSTFSGTR